MKATSSTGIDKIDVNHAAPPLNSSWVAILDKLNPLGTLAEVYARTLAYKLECKRLDAEMERVRNQAAVMHHSIDNALQMQMEDLAQRRLAIDRYFDTVQGELAQHHLERMTLLNMAIAASQHMLSPGLSSEERCNCTDMVRALTAQLPALGEQANQSLKTLLAALPQVSLPDQLLLPR